MAAALLFALALAATDAPPAAANEGEPLPPGAPQDEYLLAGWCYGALGEYLEIYDTVKPDLIDMDRMFGTSVKEDQPYASDVAASREELKVIAAAIVAAEKASAQPIAPQGALAIRAGQAIWQQAEGRSRRELARAWMSWGLPDRCDTNARQLTAKANVLGRALTYNNGASAPAPAAGAANPSDGAMTLAPIAPVRQHFANSPPPAARPVAMSAPSQAPAAGASDEPPPAATQSSAEPVADTPPAPPPPATSELVSAPASRVLGEGPPPVSPGGTVAAAAPPQAAPAPSRPAPAAAPPAVAAAPAQPPQDQSSEPVL